MIFKHSNNGKEEYNIYMISEIKYKDKGYLHGGIDGNRLVFWCCDKFGGIFNRDEDNEKLFAVFGVDVNECDCWLKLLLLLLCETDKFVLEDNVDEYNGAECIFGYKLLLLLLLLLLTSSIFIFVTYWL